MAPKSTMLIIEDIRLELGRYVQFGKSLGYDVSGVSTLEEAQALLNVRAFDVVLTDLHLTTSGVPEGLQILRLVQENAPHTVAIAMSSDPHLDLIEQAQVFGALEFLKKPLLTADEIAIVLQMAHERRRLRLTQPRLAGDPQLPHHLASQCPDGLVLSREHDRLVQVVAKNREIPTVIYGETGTGKEEIARLIHRRRAKAEGPIPFVAVNCANLNTDLSVSLLFGHRKGAFSGADRNTMGLVGEADGGILFLDEIHALSAETQHKLLRVLNDGTYTRLGDTVPLTARFQVIAASTKDLDEEVDNGTFLLDLRTRLTGIDFHLQPLRERLAEMNLFIGLYFARKEIAVSEEELQKLIDRCSQFYWRGNVRQLYKVLDALMVMAMCNDEPVRAENLPVYKTMLAPGAEKIPGTIPGVSSDAFDLFRHALKTDVPLQQIMDTVEKAMIQASLFRHKRIADVYRGLDIGRNTLDVKRKKYGL